MKPFSGQLQGVGERRLAMFNKGRLGAIVAAAGLAAAAFVISAAAPVQALTTSDRAAAILIWPKVVVDTTGQFGAPTDTRIQLSNVTRDSLKMAHCFYINANGHCADNPSEVCRTASDCSGPSACIPGWNEIDFNIFITEDQPLGWDASVGMPFSKLPIRGQGVCDAPAGRFCTEDSQCATQCIVGQTNLGTGIPPVPEDPFIGYLKCIQFDPSQNPPVPDRSPESRNALIGHATIIGEAPDVLLPPGLGNVPNQIFWRDAEKYNAIGLRATASGDTDNTLVIGGDNAEYEACPQTLIVDHLFDNALDPLRTGSTIADLAGVTKTDLTLIPCGADLLRQDPGVIVAQFLVFNEFEQRFSTSRTVDCFLETLMSNIDTPNSERSIFSATVSGTIAGQTRIRGVGGSPTGRGLIGVARLQVDTVIPIDDAQQAQVSYDGLKLRRSAAYNIHQQGDSTSSDTIIFP
jgi:hypothetical protein